MTEFITADRISQGESQTTPLFAIRGQMARWRYPDAYKRLTPEHCRKMRDMNLSERGTADVRRGYEKYNSTQLASSEKVAGLNQFTYPTHGIQRLIVTPTKVYVDDGTTRQDITGSVTWSGGVDDRCRFVFLDRKTFINNGKNQILTWDGDASTPSNVAALTGMPWTFTKDIVSHRGLLVALRPTESSVDQITRIRWSDIDRTTNDSDTGVWIAQNRTEIYEGGAPIVGGVDNWGRLWVMKEDGVYSGRVEVNFGRFEYSYMNELRGFEPIAPLSFVVRPEFIFGAAREGAFVIRPDDSIEWLTYDNQSEWRSLKQSRLQYAVAWAREGDHQIRMLCSSSDNSSGHDRIMVWDWESGDLWIDEPSNVMNYGTRSVISDVELDFFGTLDGFVHKGNAAGVLTDDGGEFEWEVDMSPNDLGAPNRRKNIIAVRTYIKQKTGGQSFTLSVELDQGKQPAITANLTGGTDQKYNTGLLYSAGLRYEGGTNQQLFIHINRIAEVLAPRWIGSDPIELVGYDVEWTPLE